LLAFEALLTQTEWRFAQNLLRNRLGTKWIVPRFEQAAMVSGSYSAGDTVITVDTTASEYYAGGYLAIWVAYDDYEIGEIASVSSGSVALVDGLTSSINGALRIMPAVVCRLVSAVDASSDRPGNRKLKMSLEAIEGPDLSGASDAITLGGYGVHTLADESDNISESIKTDIWSVDFDIGGALCGTTHVNGLRSMPQKTTLMDRAAIYAYKRWLHTKTGAVPFWRPTRFADFYLSASLGVTATSLVIVDNGFYNLRTGARAIALYYPDNTVDYRLIDTITSTTSTTTTITLTAATSNASIYTPAQVRISALMLCRLDGSAKLQHTGYDAEASYTLKEVLQ
jgi:hypothetical protein